MRTLAIVVCAGLALAGAPEARAASGPDARFEAMLDAIELAPNRAMLDAVWPDARARLMDVARDEARTAWARARAISMLGHYPDAGVRRTFVELARNSDPEIRRRGVYGLARTFGQQADDVLMSLVRTALLDRSADVRAMAVRGLGWVTHAEAFATLEALSRRTDDATASLARHVLRRRAVRAHASAPEPAQRTLR